MFQIPPNLIVSPLMTHAIKNLGEVFDCFHPELATLGNLRQARVFLKKLSDESAWVVERRLPLKKIFKGTSSYRQLFWGGSSPVNIHKVDDAVLHFEDANSRIQNAINRALNSSIVFRGRES